MSPAIKVGDVILVGPPPATLEEGMIITFQSGENELTTHRIVAIIDGNYLQTKGDANEGPDVDLVPLDKVKKAFIFRIPYLGYMGHFIRTPLGWLLLVITPASLIVFGEIKNIIAALRSPAQRKPG
jgi:signal peptidase